MPIAHTFLSYLRVNATAADRLASDLRANGVTVWLDRDMITPGEAWEDSIRKAIRSGAYFVACFSSDYLSRDTSYMDEELAIALEELKSRPQGGWLLPVRLAPCDLSSKASDLTDFLSSLQWVDLWDNWDRGVRQILDVITSGRSSHHDLRSSPATTADPYAGITNDELFAKLKDYTSVGMALDSAGRHAEAADVFAQAVRIWESIERHRLDTFDHRLFYINAFSSHFNLALTLYKGRQRLRALNEAVKAAKRYTDLLRRGEMEIGAPVRESAEVQAEALMSIGQNLLAETPSSQLLEGRRVCAAILEHLANANPVSFRHLHGIALRALALEARNRNLTLEADRSIVRAIEVLREALEMQGEAVLRDLGFAMRDAIDSFGHEHLRAEYDELVRREGEYIRRTSPAMSQQIEQAMKTPGGLTKFLRRFRLRLF